MGRFDAQRALALGVIGEAELSDAEALSVPPRRLAPAHWEGAG